MSMRAAQESPSRKRDAAHIRSAATHRLRSDRINASTLLTTSAVFSFMCVRLGRPARRARCVTTTQRKKKGHSSRTSLLIRFASLRFGLVRFVSIQWIAAAWQWRSTRLGALSVAERQQTVGRQPLELGFGQVRVGLNKQISAADADASARGGSRTRLAVAIQQPAAQQPRNTDGATREATDDKKKKGHARTVGEVGVGLGGLSRAGRQKQASHGPATAQAASGQRRIAAHASSPARRPESWLCWSDTESVRGAPSTPRPSSAHRWRDLPRATARRAAPLGAGRRASDSTCAGRSRATRRPAASSWTCWRQPAGSG